MHNFHYKTNVLYKVNMVKIDFFENQVMFNHTKDKRFTLLEFNFHKKVEIREQLWCVFFS